MTEHDSWRVWAGWLAGRLFLAGACIRYLACCSFFTFTITPAGPDRLFLDIEVPAEQIAVLTALTARASAAITA